MFDSTQMAVLLNKHCFVFSKTEILCVYTLSLHNATTWQAVCGVLGIVMGPFVLHFGRVPHKHSPQGRAAIVVHV